jgi:biotin transport system substrate-specific component
MTPISRSLDITRLPALGRTLAMIVGGSLALALSAKTQVPFWPVPVTMQSMVVLLIGAGFGSRIGTATVLAYLAEGVAGLPVFAGALAGPAYLMGPTGGFLLGFLPAAWFAGWAAREARGLAPMALAMIAAHAVLFVPGVAWLAVSLGWAKAVAVGVTPFLLATLLKSGLAAALVSVFRKDGR